MQKLQVKKFISEKQAKDMVFMFVKYGKHSHIDKTKNLKNHEQVKILFEHNGYDYEKLIQKCRNFENRVPSFEVLDPSTIEVYGSGISVSIVDYYSDKSQAELDSNGVISLCGYGSKFEEACNLRNLAIKDPSFEKICAVLSKSIASIEAYIQHRVVFWNNRICNSIRSKPLCDNKTNKISFDDKIRKWIPIMTGGDSLDLSKKTWSTFKELEEIRNNKEIHPKYPVYCVSFKDLAKYLNQFKIGIAGLLVDLHILFKEPILSSIIRASFFPEIEYI